MKILIINSGSSSLKYQLIDMQNEEVLCKGAVERIGLRGSFLTHKYDDTKIELKEHIKNHAAAIAHVFDTLTNEDYGSVKSIDEISAVGHRIVHGGEDYKHSVLITDEVLKTIKKDSPLAPLHMPANIMGIEAVKKLAPNMQNVAVFDTAFHSNMPDYAYRYALPKKAYTDYKIRRYGFHGTSHYYVSNRLAELEDKDIKDLKIITCHLGNGSSIAAVKGGVSIDTTMGFTPLEGLMMGTRSGDLDPAIHEYLMEKTGWSIKKVNEYLNKESGLLGVSGISSDMRDLLDAYGTDEDARLALNMLTYRIKKYIGSYSAVMGGVDAVVFTGGIGEHVPFIRNNSLSELEFLGIKVDENKNQNAEWGKESKISKDNSKVVVYVIPTNEELVIARDTLKLITKN